MHDPVVERKRSAAIAGALTDCNLSHVGLKGPTRREQIKLELRELAAMLFAEPEAGQRLAAQFAAEGESLDAPSPPAAKPPHRVAARRRK